MFCDPKSCWAVSNRVQVESKMSGILGNHVTNSLGALFSGTGNYFFSSIEFGTGSTEGIPAP